MLINQLIDILEKVFCQGVVRWLAKVLPNVWQKCYPTFGKSVAQRLVKLFSTFDNGIVQRLTKVFSTFGKSVFKCLIKILFNV